MDPPAPSCPSPDLDHETPVGSEPTADINSFRGRALENEIQQTNRRFRELNGELFCGTEGPTNIIIYYQNTWIAIPCDVEQN